MASGSTAVVPAGVALSYQVLDAPVHLSMLLDARCDRDDADDADDALQDPVRLHREHLPLRLRRHRRERRPHAGLEFGSAGVHALVGRSIDPPMADCLDVTLAASRHRAHQLTRADMDAADLVLTMAAEHRRYILEEWPDLGRKSFVLGHATRELQRIPDDLSLSHLAGHLWRRRTVSGR